MYHYHSRCSAKDRETMASVEMNMNPVHQQQEKVAAAALATENDQNQGFSAEMAANSEKVAGASSNPLSRLEASFSRKASYAVEGDEGSNLSWSALAGTSGLAKP